MSGNAAAKSGVMNKIKNSTAGKDFFTSGLYLFLLAVATVATWVTGALWIVVSVYIVSLVVIAFTQKTLAGLLPIAGTFIMGYSVKQSDIKADMSATIIAAVIFIAVMAVCCVIWFVKNRKSVSLRYFPKVPYILLVVALILGGVGAGYLFKPQWFGGVAIGAVFLLALVALTSANPKPLDKEFLCRILIMMGSIIVLETFAFYFKEYLNGTLEHAIDFKTLDYGWCVSNGGGTMLLMAIPAVFYYATKRRFPILEVLMFIVLAITLLMTNSRGAQLAFVMVILPLLIYSFCKTKSKLGYIIAVFLGLVVIAGILLLLLYKNSGFLERWISVGFSDSGRIVIYQSCFKEIISGNFLFGWGFFHPLPGITTNNFLAHDTFLQFWTNMGLFGLFTFILVLIANYRVILKKNGSWGVLMAMALLSAGLYGVIDNTYFTPYYMPMLLVFLVIGSNVWEFRVKKEKEDAARMIEERKQNDLELAARENSEKSIPHIKYN